MIAGVLRRAIVVAEVLPPRSVNPGPARGFVLDTGAGARIDLTAIRVDTNMDLYGTLKWTEEFGFIKGYRLSCETTRDADVTFVANFEDLFRNVHDEARRIRDDGMIRPSERERRAFERGMRAIDAAERGDT